MFFKKLIFSHHHLSCFHEVYNLAKNLRMIKEILMFLQVDSTNHFQWEKSASTFIHKRKMSSSLVYPGLIAPKSFKAGKEVSRKKLRSSFGLQKFHFPDIRWIQLLSGMKLNYRIYQLSSIISAFMVLSACNHSYWECPDLPQINRGFQITLLGWSQGAEEPGLSSSMQPIFNQSIANRRERAILELFKSIQCLVYCYFWNGRIM